VEPTGSFHTKSVVQNFPNQLISIQKKKEEVGIQNLKKHPTRGQCYETFYGRM
jgi:hypothetical protein